jgi:hypothetical protein
MKKQPIFRTVQPGAEARIRAEFVPNNLGKGDAVEQFRAAYTKFMQTAEGTPKYKQAWGELVDVLFANAT